MHTLTKLKHITFLLAGVMAAMVFFPTEALAATIPGPDGGAWEVYGVGNAAMLRQAFIGIELMVNSKAYMSAVSVFALLGFVAVMFHFLSDPIFGFRKFIRYIILLIFMSAAFTIKADVTIKDFVTPNSSVVRGVPAILVLPASIFSTIGQYMARMFTQYLAPVKSQHFPEVNERSAFGLGAQMVIDAAEMRFSDQDFTNNVSRYIVDCVSPLLYRQLIDPNDVRNSSDLWTLFSERTTQHAEGMLTKYYNKKAQTSGGSSGAGKAGSNMETVLCKDMAAQLQKDLDDEYASGIWRAFIDKKMGTQQSANSTALGVDMTKVKDYFSEFMRYSFGAPGPEYNDLFIRQAAMVNLINYQMPNQMAQITGSGVIAMKLANNSDSRGMEIQQTGAARTTFATSGYFYSVMQILIIALGPIVLLALFIPGAGSKVFSSYMLMLAWFPACLITMAICNSLMLYWFTDMIVSIASPDYSATQGTGNITLGNRFAMTAQTAKFMAISSWLGTLAPVLAFGLLTGSTMLLGRLLGNMSHAAGDGQQAIASGQLGRTKGQGGRSMMDHGNGKIGFGSMGLPDRRLAKIGSSGIEDRQAMRTLDGMGGSGSGGGASDRIGKTISGNYGNWQKGHTDAKGRWHGGMDGEAESRARDQAVSEMHDRNARASHEAKMNAPGGPLSQIKEMGRREAANNQHVQAAVVTANQAKIDRGEGHLTPSERQNAMQGAAANLPYANPRHLDGNQGGLSHHVPRFGETGASATQGAERNVDTGSVLNADGSHSAASAVGETKGYRSVPLNDEQIAARGNFNRYNELVEKGNNATREESLELQRMVDGGFVQNYQEATTQAPAAAAPVGAGVGVGGAAAAAAVGAGVGAAAGAAAAHAGAPAAAGAGNAAAPAPMGMAPTYADGNWRAQADAIRDTNNVPLIAARADQIDPANAAGTGGYHSPAVMQQATHDVAHMHGASVDTAQPGQVLGDSGLRGSPGLVAVNHTTESTPQNIMANMVDQNDPAREGLIQERMDEIRGFDEGLSEADLRLQAENDINQAGMMPADITAIHRQPEEEMQAQSNAAINSSLGITSDHESARFEKLDPNAPVGQGLPENHTGHDAIRAKGNYDVLGGAKGAGIATAAAVSTLGASNSFESDAAAVDHIINGASHQHVGRDGTAVGALIQDVAPIDMVGKVQVPDADGLGGTHAATAADVAQWKDDLQIVQAHDRGENVDATAYADATAHLAAVAGPLQQHAMDNAKGHHDAIMTDKGEIRPDTEYKGHISSADEKLLRTAHADMAAPAGTSFSNAQLNNFAKLGNLHQRLDYNVAADHLDMAHRAGVLDDQTFKAASHAFDAASKDLIQGKALSEEKSAAIHTAQHDEQVAMRAFCTKIDGIMDDRTHIDELHVSAADQAALQQIYTDKIDGAVDAKPSANLDNTELNKMADVLSHATQNDQLLQESQAFDAHLEKQEALMPGGMQDKLQGDIDKVNEARDNINDLGSPDRFSPENMEALKTSLHDTYAHEAYEIRDEARELKAAFAEQGIHSHDRELNGIMQAGMTANTAASVEDLAVKTDSLYDRYFSPDKKYADALNRVVDAIDNSVAGNPAFDPARGIIAECEGAIKTHNLHADVHGRLDQVATNLGFNTDDIKEDLAQRIGKLEGAGLSKPDKHTLANIKAHTNQITPDAFHSAKGCDDVARTCETLRGLEKKASGDSSSESSSASTVDDKGSNKMGAGGGTSGGNPAKGTGGQGGSGSGSSSAKGGAAGDHVHGGGQGHSKWGAKHK